MAKTEAQITMDLVRFLEDRARQVKFSAEEIATILDDVAWIMAHRYRETEPVAMEEWATRLLAELMISKDRKAFQEHGTVDLAEHYGFEKTET